MLRHAHFVAGILAGFAHAFWSWCLTRVFRLVQAGVYFVGVLFDGVDIGGSPFKLTVDPGPTHANGCSASGPGITGRWDILGAYLTQKTTVLNPPNTLFIL
jgi:hypothetical protein